MPSNNRALALGMMRKLHKAARGSMMEWRAIDLIVQRGMHSVRLTVEGWRVAK